MTNDSEADGERPVGDIPSALQDFAAVRARIGDRRPALFLDYDGTLTPIVDRPDLAILSDEARAVVDAAARRLPVAVISGRDRADVARLVGIDSITIAGSHGFDIAAPGGGALSHQVGGDFTPLLDEVEEMLHRHLDPIPGALVERKRFSIAAHYRLVAPERAGEVRRAVEDIVAGQKKLKIKPGKMVLEIQPDIDWHKGKAVLWLLKALHLDCDGVVPVFLGDDVTDEDAFRALRGRGLGVVVAGPDENRRTAAEFRLDDPSQVLEFLKRLAT